MLDVNMQINVLFCNVKLVFQRYMYIMTVVHYDDSETTWKDEENIRLVCKKGLYLIELACSECNRKLWRINRHVFVTLQLYRLYLDAILVQRINTLTTNYKVFDFWVEMIPLIKYMF